MKLTYSIVLVSILCAIDTQARDIEREFTIEIKPGREECFYQDVKSQETLDIEYQVIDGGQGNLDINFYIQGSSGAILVHDVKTADQHHRTKMSEDGDYKICWDNRISRLNTKTVFFAMTVTSEDDNDGLWGDGFDSVISGGEDYDMRIEDIRDGMDVVRRQLSEARAYQDQIRAYEARDRNIAENNYTKVNYLSLFNMMAMLATGLMQVFLVRSLFDEKSKLHRLWKKKS